MALSIPVSAPTASHRRLGWLRTVPWLALLVLAAVGVCAIGGEDILPQDPNGLNLSDAFRPPFWVAKGGFDNLLGTDNLGRDILSRILAGCRISVIVCAYAIVFSGGIG